MKKTDFTFFSASMKGLLSLIVPVLFFMTLSSGLGAQNTLQEAVVLNSGRSIVNFTVAKDRLVTHVAALQAMTPSSDQEEAVQQLSIRYAGYIDSWDESQGSFAYHVINSQAYLEREVAKFSGASRPSATALYNEMLQLLQ
jgi:hypothetical protein